MWGTRCRTRCPRCSRGQCSGNHPQCSNSSSSSSSSTDTPEWQCQPSRLSSIREWASMAWGLASMAWGLRFDGQGRMFFVHLLTIRAILLVKCHIRTPPHLIPTQFHQVSNIATNSAEPMKCSVDNHPPQVQMKTGVPKLITLYQSLTLSYHARMEYMCQDFKVGMPKQRASYSPTYNDRHYNHLQKCY